MSTKVFLFLMLALAMISGCSKESDDNPTGPGASDDAPTFKTPAISIPEKMRNSNDDHAQEVGLYVNLATVYGSSINANFRPPSLQKGLLEQNDGPWEYNWQEGDLTKQVIIKKTDGTYTWEVIWNGNDGNLNFTNWLAYRAKQLTNARNGEFYKYASNDTTISAQFIWSLDEMETLQFEVFIADFTLIPSELIRGNRFVGVVKADKSGILEVYRGDENFYVLFEKYVWNAQGAGEWSQYENGQIVDSSSWL